MMTSLREAALVFVGVTAVTFGITRLRGVPVAGEYVHVAVAFVFLLVAVRLAQREPDGARRYGIDLAGLLAPTEDDDRPAGPFGLFDLGRALAGALPAALRETAIAVGIAALLFPPFALAFWWWHEPRHPFEWAPPPDWAEFALAQLLVVGLPEEALFRGYFQTRLTDAWPKTRR
ncbi:MAG: glutamic-type intramembrane protease, partial [Polyangiales bacterium]